eukprot:COSAG06_NODE_818_length_12113_cov_9.211670_3_plen_184_part_00
MLASGWAARTGSHSTTIVVERLCGAQPPRIEPPSYLSVTPLPASGPSPQTCSPDLSIPQLYWTTGLVGSGLILSYWQTASPPMSIARSFLQWHPSPPPWRPLQSLSKGECVSWHGGRQPFVGSDGSCVGLPQMPRWYQDGRPSMVFASWSTLFTPLRSYESPRLSVCVHDSGGAGGIGAGAEQ